MAKLRKLVIGAPRSGEKDETEVRWLISYSDFMMQLVCLFILLYSVSFFDKGRMARIAAAYRASVGLGDLAALETKSLGDRLAVGDRPLLGGDLGGGDVPKGVLFRVEPVPGGWRLAFDQPLFDPGSADLTAAGGDALDAAARLLRAYAGRSAVTAFGEDATDADPLRLALARSRAAGERLARAGLDPRFVTVAGQPQRPGTDSRRVTLELRTE
ncbi:MAG TPA: flagellar motor protein MotB [Planctomycetota bacterium]|jgi:flagellar motor protein MotB|nr:flagellar motor protein MotB [Planctomycetota bacterium]